MQLNDPNLPVPVGSQSRKLKKKAQPGSDKPGYKAPSDRKQWLLLIGYNSFINSYCTPQMLLHKKKMKYLALLAFLFFDAILVIVYLFIL